MAPSPRAAPPNLEQRVTSLSAALRRARIDSAAQSGVLADLRGAEIARLEILREQLEPVLAQLPRDCDLFDVAVSPGERPRLFIDQIGFVELAHDQRTYRFLQDTRHGRIKICENDKLDAVVDAITAYIAHRLIERRRRWRRITPAAGRERPSRRGPPRARRPCAEADPRKARFRFRRGEFFCFSWSSWGR